MIDGETIWLDVAVVLERPLAYLFDTDAGEVWIAKSTIGASKRDTSGEPVRIEIPVWIAKEKGLWEGDDVA